MTIREIVKVIEEEGWYMVMMKDGARQYKHPKLPGRVTLAGDLDLDLSPTALAMIGIPLEPAGR